MSVDHRWLARAPFFDSHDRVLHAESLSLELLAERYGTPLYVYSKAAILAASNHFIHALGGQAQHVCYAVKANSNLTILQLLAKLGMGFDIVSMGELERVLRADGTADRIVFSGVGKRENELLHALDAGIRCFNVESEPELNRLTTLAESCGKTAAIALRINPRITTGTHPHLATGHGEAKFGVDIERAKVLYQSAAKLPGLRLIGIACHIGSQITQPEPFLEAARRIMELTDHMRKAGVALEHVDFGGGFGVPYRDEPLLDVISLIGELRKQVEMRGLKMLVEPGRALVAEAGVLLTRVEYLKDSAHGGFAVVDAGMTELIRPPLYDAWHEIRPVNMRTDAPLKIRDVVGPVCESADFLGRNRQLALRAGDLLAVMDTGAYGFSMSSNYNTRPRAAEVLVDGGQATLIRRRETLNDLMAAELPVKQ